MDAELYYVTNRRHHTPVTRAADIHSRPPAVDALEANADLNPTDNDGQSPPDLLSKLRTGREQRET